MNTVPRQKQKRSVFISRLEPAATVIHYRLRVPVARRKLLEKTKHQHTATCSTGTFTLNQPVSFTGCHLITHLSSLMPRLGLYSCVSVLFPRCCLVAISRRTCRVAGADADKKIFFTSVLLIFYLFFIYF